MQTIRQSGSNPLHKRMFAIRMVGGNRSGFTLVELLIVSAILTALAIIAYASYGKIKELARTSRCMQEIRGMEREISAYATEKGNYPPSLADINRDTLRDPWGSLYIYSVPTRTFGGPDINIDFDLYSKGSDGATADSITDAVSKDDIIRGRDGSFVGMANKY